MTGVFSRRVVGWAIDTAQRADLATNALGMAIDSRRPSPGAIIHGDLAQYTSIAFTGRLAAAGVSGSAGTVGDACDNALAESVIGLFKTELIKPRAPWRTVEQVELATLEYIDWSSQRRLYEACGDIPPAELEAAYYRQNTALAEAGQTTT